MSDNRSSQARKTFKRKHYSQNNYSGGGVGGGKSFMKAGQRGFLATCNFREKDCVRECYNILNQFADELYGPANAVIRESPDGNGQKSSDKLDASEELEQEISSLKTEGEEKKYRFNVANTGATNCIFINTTLENPVQLGERIVQTIAKENVRRTRYLLRLVPVSTVCKANLKDILEAFAPLVEEYFAEATTFSVVYNKRYNNDLNRDEIIKKLAEAVAAKNPDNKVDLKNASHSIVVEIIKGVCCLSVLKDYLKLRKYNLAELTRQPEAETDEALPDKKARIEVEQIVQEEKECQ